MRTKYGAKSKEEMKTFYGVEQKGIFCYPLYDEIVGVINQCKPDAKKFLDFGCGDGDALISITLPFNGEGIGFDINKKRIKAAKMKSNHIPNIRFFTADAEDFSIREQFDVILCIEVLEASFNNDKILASIRELMGDDTLLVAVVPNTYNPLRIFQKADGYVTPKKFEKFFTDKGFRVVKKISHYSKYLRFIPNWLLFGTYLIYVVKKDRLK